MLLFDCLGLTESLVLAMIAVILLYILYGRGKKYNLPPGPRPLPVIGNILTFVLSKKSVILQLSDLADKYGPIYSVRFGSFKAVVVSNITLVNEALLTKPTDFAGRPTSYSVDIFTEGRKDIAFSDYGPTWRLERKIASKALRTYLSGTQLELRIHKALGGIIQLIEAEKGPFNPKEYISLLVINFIAAFCFGVSYSLEDKEPQYLLSVTDSFVETAANGLPEDFLPALRHLRLKRSVKLLAQVEEFLELLRQKYREHQKTFDADNIRDFTDCLIAAEIESQAEEGNTELSKLTNTHFTQILSDIFGAGMDTSRFTLYWAILHCITFPEVQEKMHREIIDVVGTSRLPGVDDKKRLPYTQATLYESMRLASVAPMGLPHSAMVDGQIGGYDVPKDTMVIINHWALHHDPTFWAEPEEFRPERFLAKDGSLAPKPDNFLPFSMGRRVCLGEAVAKPELLLMLAALVHKFKFSLPDGETVSLEPTGGIGGLVPKPYKVVAERRF